LGGRRPQKKQERTKGKKKQWGGEGKKQIDCVDRKLNLEREKCRRLKRSERESGEVKKGRKGGNDSKREGKGKEKVGRRIIGERREAR